MGTINRVILAGRLGRDPESKATQTGLAVTTFSLATSRYRKGPDGKEECDWHRIVAFGKPAEFAGKNVHKGDLVGIDGRLQCRSYVDKAGQKRFTVEVVAEKVEKLAAAAAAAATKNGAVLPPPGEPAVPLPTEEELANLNLDLPEEEETPF